MPTINDIANAASYKGDARLGGYIPDAIEIDTKPLEDLAKYTILYNKSEYDQRQKDAELRATDLAQIAAFDFSKVDEQWRNPISEKFNELTKYVRDNPDVFNYQKNPNGWLEYRRLKNEVNQAVTSGGANQVLLEARKEGIAKAGTAEKKAMLERELANDMAKTGLYDKLPVEEQYTITFEDIATPQQLSFDAIEINSNENIKRNFKLPDMQFIDAQAKLLEFNEMTQELNLSDQLKSATTEEDKSRIKGEQDRRKLGKKGGWLGMAEIANTVLNNPAYYTNGEIDMNKLLSNSNTSALAGMIQSYNGRVAQEKKRVESGIYKDKKGGKVTFDTGGINPAYYTPINIKDGISVAEVAKVWMLSKAPSNVETTAIQETDNAIQVLNINTDAESQRQGRANAMAIAKLPYEQMKLSAKGTAVGEMEYNPLASIIASVGSLNTPTGLENLSIAQVAAINPSYIDSNGQLTDEAKAVKISVGAVSKSKAADGTDVFDYGVFILGDGKKAVTSLNESNLLSNGASYLISDGKERKGQDAYVFKQDLLIKALGRNESPSNGNNSASAKTKQPTSGVITGFDNNGNPIYKK